MTTTQQKIKRSELKEIYSSNICDNWKKIISDLVMWSAESTISVEESLILKAHNEANAEQKKLIEKYFKIVKPEDICEKIQNWDDILEITGKEDYKDPILKPKTKEEKSINALSRIFLICKAYNGVDFKFNWKNTNEYKWRLYKNFAWGGSWDVCGWWDCLDAPGGAHFKTEKFAKDALKKFEPIFEDFYFE